MNVHFSLLPRWRGAAPVQRAILEGDEVTGVTVMLMDEGMDTGPVLATVETAIEPDEDAGSLGARLAELGSPLLVETLRGLGEGTVAPSSQDHAAATYAPKLLPEERTIHWDEPADNIVRRIRSLAPDPGAVTTFREGRLKVLVARAIDESRSVRPDPSVPGVVERWDRDPLVRRVAGPGGAARGGAGRTQADVRRGMGARRADRTRRAPRMSPSARQVALEVIRRVADEGAYSNRLLPCRSRTVRPGRPRSRARDRARLRNAATRARARRGDRRARRETGSPDDAGRARRAAARRLPDPAHADPGACGGRRDRRCRRPEGAWVRERDPSPAGEGAARRSRRCGRSRDQPPDRDDAVGGGGAPEAPSS